MEEALALTKLAHLKDASLDSRRLRVVADLIGDTNLPREARCQLEAGSANVDIALNNTLTPDQKFAAFAEVAWRLVGKYPERNAGYEALERIARESNDEAGQKIARRLLSSEAPEPVKAAARDLIKRQELVGKSLIDLLGSGIVAQRSRIYLFTWSTKVPSTLALGRKLKESMPTDASLVGICMDSDVDTARAVAAESKLPGQLIYDALGSDSALCKRLLLSGGTKVYITNSNGKIANVSGLNQLMNEAWAKKNGRAQ